MARRLHSTWEEVTVHTAKCDFCNQHNSAKLFRCWTCAQHLCTPCSQRGASDSMHVFPGRVAPPPADDPNAQPIQGIIVPRVGPRQSAAVITKRPRGTTRGVRAAAQAAQPIAAGGQPGWASGHPGLLLNPLVAQPHATSSPFPRLPPPGSLPSAVGSFPYAPTSPYAPTAPATTRPRKYRIVHGRKVIADGSEDEDETEEEEPYYQPPPPAGRREPVVPLDPNLELEIDPELRLEPPSTGAREATSVRTVSSLSSHLVRCERTKLMIVGTGCRCPARAL